MRMGREDWPTFGPEGSPRISLRLTGTRAYEILPYYRMLYGARRRGLASALFALSLSCSPPPPKEVPTGEAQGRAPLSVLLLSDIHFEPFHDKSLAESLIKAPVSGWEAIFKAGSQKSYSDYKSDINFALF